LPVSKTFKERCDLVARAKPPRATRLVYGWIRGGAIQPSQFFKLLPLISQECACERCHGARFGIPGNENVVIIDGVEVTLCNKCYSDYINGK
jgi:hypothetical protein